MVVDSVISQKAFDEQTRLDDGFEKNKKSLKEFAEAASSIKFNIGDAKVFSDINNQLKKLSALTVQVSKVTKEQLEIAKKKADLDAKNARAAAAKERQVQQEIKTQQAQIKLEIEHDKAKQQTIKTKQQEVKLENDVITQVQKELKVRQQELSIEKSISASKEKVEKQTIKESKAQEALIDDYKLLVKAQQEASLRYKNLSLRLGENHELTVQAREDANAMRDVIVRLDAGVQEYGKNVGNYNAVGSQFNQLLREAPNAAISFRTFLISITNNITYFFEAMKNARAAGQSWGQILKSVGSSLFGLVGFVNLAIVAIGFLAQRMASSKKSTDDAKDSIDKFNNALQRTIDLRKEQEGLNKDPLNIFPDTQSLKDMERYVDLLRAQGADLDTIYDAQQKVFEERKRLLAFEELNYKDVLTNLKDYKTALEEGQNATQKQNDLVKLLVGALGISKKEATDMVNGITSSTAVLNQTISDVQKNLVKVSDAQKDLTNESKIYTEQYKQAQLDAFLKQRDQEDKAAKEARKRRQKELEELLQQQALTGNLRFRLLQQQAQQDNAVQDEIINNQTLSLDKRLSALDTHLSNELFLIEAEKKKELENTALTEEQKQLIRDFYLLRSNQAYEAYLKKQTELNKSAADEQFNDLVKQYNNIEALRLERLNKQLLNAQSEYKAGNITFDQYQKQRNDITDQYEQETYDKQVQYLQDSLKNFKGTQEQKWELQKMLTELLKVEYDKDVQNQKDAEAKKKKQIQATLQVAQRIVEIQQQAYNSENERSNRSIENIRNERDEFERNAKIDLDRIARTEKDEEEKNRKIAAAEAKLFTQRRALEHREKDAKIRAARAERQNNISLIIQRTALAVITALTEGDPLTKFFRAAAAGVAGASALASALSTPVPQYAGGTKHHKGGPFVAGDGGEPELVIPSDGSAPYMTSDKPGLYNEPKGTQVYNQDQIRNKIGYDALTPHMDNVMGRRKRNIDQSSAIVNAIEKGNRETIKAIRRNRSINTVNIITNDLKFQVNRRGTRNGYTK